MYKKNSILHLFDIKRDDMMKEILTKNHIVKVSDEDYNYLNKFTWHIMKTAYGKLYARRWDTTVTPKKAVFMHREILGETDKLEVDHINRDTLDNRRENLRYATRQQNTWNRKRRINSDLHGVSLTKKGKWHVQITNPHNRNRIHLGDYDILTLALQVYDAVAKDLHGEFAVQNLADAKQLFPEETIQFYLEKNKYNIKKSA